MLQFEKQYRMKHTPLSDDELNRRWQHLDVRLHGLEEKIGRFDASVDALVARGLARINTELSGTIDGINVEVDNVQALVEGVETLVGELEQQIEDILTGGTLPATAITVAAIGGITATNAQTAMAELRAQIAVLESAFTGIGDVQVVADLTAAAALTGLDGGDLVHVLDNGASKWARYQITSAGDGTWGEATRVVIWTQDQAPATHQHGVGDVTGLQPALDVLSTAVANNAADIATKAPAAVGQGQHTIWLPAGAMIPSETSGAESKSEELATNDVMVSYLAFDAATKEYAQFTVQMPKSWNGGSVVAQFLWKHSATATNFGVVWGIQAVSFANDDAMDEAFGAAQEVADTGGTTADLYITTEASAMTPAGSLTSEALVVFRVYRDPTNASDTLAVDAHLIGVKIHYTTNAATDD